MDSVRKFGYWVRTPLNFRPETHLSSNKASRSIVIHIHSNDVNQIEKVLIKLAPSLIRALSK
jgi:hypothetical protein